jgi:hypothetical protein
LVVLKVTMSVAGFLDHVLRRIFGLRVVPQARYDQLTALEAGQQDASLAATPPLSNDRLLELAAARRPPQSWYDEKINPFEPSSR